jgi:hypothetical protein
MLVEYGGWSKMTGKKREAISSSESFEQANLSDMSRQTQRARTKSAFRSNLRTASPTPSLWSSSDISDGGAVPVQVVVNKSGAELAVERQKAHGSMIMAAIAMKKQAFETAKEMHRLFPADDRWCEALQDAAREYMAACKMDVLAAPPAGWASESEPDSRPPEPLSGKRLSEDDRNLQDFQTPEPQRGRRRQSDEDDDCMFFDQNGEASVTYEENTEWQPPPPLLHGCDLCRQTHTELQALAVANPDRPAKLFALSMCLSNPTNVNLEPNTCTRLVCGDCETEPHPGDDTERRGRWCSIHLNRHYAVIDREIMRGTNIFPTNEPDPRLFEPPKRGRPSKEQQQLLTTFRSNLSRAVPTRFSSEALVAGTGCAAAAS